MKENNHDILIIGDLMLDIYYQGLVTRISPEAPVPVFKKDTSERFVPGGACNVAMNIKAAGKNAFLFGVIGKDENGAKLERILKEAGVDLKGIHRLDIDTISKTRFLSKTNQQLLRMDIENVDDIKRKINYDNLLHELEQLIPNYEVIVLSDYMKGLLTYDFTQTIINTANKYSVKVLVDVKDSNYKKYVGAWLLKPNIKELSSITNISVETHDEVVNASRYLLNLADCEYVLTTCGARGMVLVGRDSVYQLDTEGKTVYDVTGAGDTVIAYLASQLIDGECVERAVEIANYAAGIQVGKVGTATVYIQEVRELMDGVGSNYIKKKLRWRNLDDFRKKIEGKKLVFTNGCFDILHVGHKRYLEEAKKLGDLLVVGVNSDDSVKRLKGLDRPVNIERDRVEMLTALDCVDYVIVFEDDTPYDLIKLLKPDVLVKGGDYSPEEVVGKDIVELNGGEVVIIPLVEGKSTTAVIEKIKL